MRPGRRHFRSFVLVAAIMLLPVRPGLADEWIALETPHFLVLSQVPEKRARRIFDRLHIYMQALPVMTNLPMRTPSVPTRIFLLDNADFQRVKKGHGDISGIFMSDSFRNAMVVNAAGDLESSLQTVQHEYFHFAVRNAGITGIPAFYEEGLAELVETFTFQGLRFNWGYFPAGYQRIASSKAMPLTQLLSIQTGSKQYYSEHSQPQFYARSLLLVHYCMLGNPECREPLIRTASRVADSESPLTVFAEEFGRNPDDFDRELDTYLARRAEGGYASLPASERNRDPAMQSRLLGPGEGALEFAELLLENAPDDPEIVPQLEALSGTAALQDRVLAGLALAYEHQERRPDADAQLDKLATLPNASPAALIRAGELLVDRVEDLTDQVPPVANFVLTNNLRRAGSFFDAALMTQPESVEAIFWHGYVQLQMGDDLAASARLLGDAYVRSPTNAQLGLLLAQYFDALGDEDLAQKIRRGAACRANSAGTRRYMQEKLGAFRCFAPQ